MITTITTTTQEDLRIATAFGSKLGLSGNATAAQVKADIVAYVTTVVIDYEYQNNRAAALATTVITTPINPT